MRKKEEGCCEGSCSCGGNPISLGAILVAINLIISVIVLCTVKNIRNDAIEAAGGQETYAKMQEIYKTEEFKNTSKEQVDYAYDHYVKGENGETENTENTTVNQNDGESVMLSTGEPLAISTLSDEAKAAVENILATAPVRGNQDARFTIIEYTELLCPYCQRHAQSKTIQTVMDAFPGEINSVSRHFIIHGDEAVKLSNAMECIAEMNKDVYYSVFEEAFNQYPVSIDGLKAIAMNAGIDQTNLQTCIDENRYQNAVYDMMNQGNTLFGVNGTPGNVIIDKETGKWTLISGAYPSEDFMTVINHMKA